MFAVTIIYKDGTRAAYIMDPQELVRVCASVEELRAIQALHAELLTII